MGFLMAREPRGGKGLCRQHCAWFFLQEPWRQSPSRPAEVKDNIFHGFGRAGI